MKNICLCVSFIFVGLISYSQKNKEIKIHNDIVFKLPADWKNKGPYLKFSNYQIILNNRLENKVGSSKIDIRLYDSAFGAGKTIDSSLIAFYKKEFLLYINPKANVIQSGVLKQNNGNQIAFFQYSFLTKGLKIASGIQFCFKNFKSEFYYVEISCEGKSSTQNDSLAKSIFNSKLILSNKISSIPCR